MADDTQPNDTHGDLRKQVLRGLTGDSRRLLLCPQHFSTEGRLLLLDKCTVVKSFRNWKEEDLQYWVQDEYQGKPGEWWVEDRALWNRVAPIHTDEGSVAQASILWYRDKLSTPNHAIRMLAASMPISQVHPVVTAQQIGEINCIWNGTGTTAGPPWTATIGSFFGWYVGFNGMEYLFGEGDAENTKSLGKYVSRSMALKPANYYEIVCGHYEGVDFVYIDGQPVMQTEPPARPQELDRLMVALEGFSNDRLAAILRFDEVEIFEIPPDAVEPIEFREHDEDVGDKLGTALQGPPKGG